MSWGSLPSTPRLQALANNWIMLMARLVAPYVGDEVSLTVSAVYEGTLFRQIVSGRPPERKALEDHFRRACGQPVVRAPRGCSGRWS
jgi:hypothetical protein